MVLGLMDFLLGGKKKTKVPKNAQVATPSQGQAQNANQENNAASTTPADNLPDGAGKPTENTNDKPEFVDSNKSDDGSSTTPAEVKATNPQGSGSAQSTGSSGGAPAGKKSVSEAIHKLHSDLKESTDRMTGMVTEFKDMEGKVTDIGNRLEVLEEDKKQTTEKLHIIDEQMTKFLSLYELINNQYNPFIDKDTIPVQIPKVELDAMGNEMAKPNPNTPDLSAVESKKIEIKDDLSDLESALVELDTLNIEEAAGDAVPLTHLKNNTNSLVIILSWLEYLIKRAGMEETRNTLRYYTEVLRWITPEVYFELDKYLKGMKNKEEGQGDINVKDHIVSLYFISKLNEKKLDEKLTGAVLKIIKQ
jgi:archaellum component FlaD/FlaE